MRSQNQQEWFWKCFKKKKVVKWTVGSVTQSSHGDYRHYWFTLEQPGNSFPMVFNGTWIFCPNLPCEVEPPARKCNSRALNWQLSEVQQPCFSTGNVWQDGGFQATPKSQNHLGWKRKDLQDWVQPVTDLHLVTQIRALSATFKSVLKHLQGWRLHHLPGQPLPMPDNPFHEEMDGSWKQGNLHPQELGERILTRTTRHWPSTLNHCFSSKSFST